MKRKQVKRQQPITPADPRELAASYRSMLSPHEYELLIQELEVPLPPAIRVNAFKSPPDLPRRLSQKYGWQLEPIPFCPAGYRVITGGGPEVSAVFEHRLGMYYIQEAASMLPAELFTIEPGSGHLVLDLAASPGGKTTHLVSRLGDTGLVLANDSSQGRIQALRIVLQNWGAVNVGITRFPGERFGDWYPGTFDRVLLDAPCSMQGLRTAESHTSRPVTEKESLQLSRRQRALLTSAVRALRVGGEVVYSTCTLLPLEDEAVVNAVLAEFGSAIEILDAQAALPVPAPGLTSLNGVNFHTGLEKTVRLWPQRYHTAGFFVCHLKKTDLVERQSSPPPFRPMEQVGFQQMTTRDERAFCEAFTGTFGFDLAADLERFQRILVRRYEEVLLFPASIVERFHGLPLQSAGMLLGQETPDGFLPSHEWTGRFGSLCGRNIIRLDEQESEIWMRGADLEARSSPVKKGDQYRIVVNAEGLVLGCGKVTATGLKNLLPRRLL